MRTLTFAPTAAGCRLTGADPTLNSPLESSASRPSGAQSDLQPADIDALIARDYVGLRTLLFRRTGDPHVAADLLNDAICTALEKYRAGQIAAPEQIAGYVFQVAMNHLRNRRRSIHQRPERHVTRASSSHCRPPPEPTSSTVTIASSIA